MKIFCAAASPFVRKCLVAADELGLRDRIELVPVRVHPVKRDPTVAAHNPLGKIPTLIADDGTALHDSRVICEYLNAVAGGNLFPQDEPARWRVLCEQSLADGIMDAAVLMRYETAERPEALRWNEWIAGQQDKVNGGLAELEGQVSGFGDRVDIGTIAFGCALGYLDFRFPTPGWRGKHPKTAAWFERFGARPSMVATRPPAA